MGNGDYKESRTTSKFDHWLYIANLDLDETKLK